MFVGLSPTDVAKRFKAASIIDNISNHQQCVPALERSKVTLFKNTIYNSENFFFQNYNQKKDTKNLDYLLFLTS